VQVRADHEFHGDVGVVAALAPFSDVVDRDDVGVIQTAGDLGLVVEALQELLLLPRTEREGEGDRLEGHCAADPRSRAFVDDPMDPRPTSSRIS